MKAEEIQNFIEWFKPVYIGRENVVPTDVKITVWCEDEDEFESGFAEDIYWDDLGLNALIAKSWIEHEELLKLMKTKK